MEGCKNSRSGFNSRAYREQWHLEHDNPSRSDAHSGFRTDPTGSTCSAASYGLPIDPSQMTPEIAARKAKAESVPVPTAQCDADRHAITDMHAQLVKIRYGALDLKDKLSALEGKHQAEIAEQSTTNAAQIQMQQTKLVHAAENMRAHAAVQETRIKVLMAEKAVLERERAQLRWDVREFKEVVREKEKKIWKYTQQLGDKAADLDMVRGDRDAHREVVKKLNKKVMELEAARQGVRQL